MNRRGFFGALARVGSCAALASLSYSLAPTLHGDGLHDDSLALSAWGAGRPVKDPHGRLIGRHLMGKTFRLTKTLDISRTDCVAITNCTFFWDGPEKWMRIAA